MSGGNIQYLIPILTVAISVIASLIVTTLRNKADLRKIQIELDQKYAKSLFNKRVEVYPELYEISSSYSKTIQYNQHTVENLIEYRNKIDDWNSKYGIFFTEATAYISYRFRDYLRWLLLNGADSKVLDEDWNTIRKIQLAFERSIRAEIGIYDTKPVGQMEGLNNIYNYIDTKCKKLKTANLCGSNPSFP